ncbi:MAG: hypothetical protein PQJ59_06300 [Spirochaetales bacterium]|nr:hypothetical protein [Spirochaetales bacterium]
MNKMIQTIVLCLLSTWFVLSCSEPSSESISYNDDGTCYVDPIVSLVDSSDYTISDCGLVRASSTSDYMYGIFEVEYTGDENILFPRADFVFKDINGNILYTDFTFIYNDGMAIMSSDADINTYLTPEDNVGYMRIIEDLGDYSIYLGNIYSVEITISDSNSSLTSTLSEVLDCPFTMGDLVHEEDSSVWYTPATNTDTQAVSLEFSFTLFNDTEGRIGYWSSSNTYESSDGETWAQDDDIIDPDQTARVFVSKTTPDYLGTDNLIYYKDCLMCSYSDDETASTSYYTILSRSSTSGMTEDEVNEALLNELDEQIALLEGSMVLSD